MRQIVRERALSPVKIAIVGFGKIARDQHAPSITETDGLELVATVSRRGGAPEGIPPFPTLDALIASDLKVDAVALCTPPEGRSKMAMAAADHGWDILLEKPPGQSAAEVMALADYVHSAGRIVFTTWHSQYNAAVDAAAQRLADQDIRAMRIDWREDVRKWHPGQDWIWEAGGFGVFDPGINALSIATKIMPDPLVVEKARLTIAENHQSPIAVDLEFGAQLSAHFDWRETGGECWRITVETAKETLVLDKGGSELWVNGEPILAQPSREYQSIYTHFSDLLRRRQSHVDIAPLQLVEEAQRIGAIHRIDAFAV
jgi:D-galactose 1-dehydrogenase